MDVSTAAVILAGGSGTRINSNHPQVFEVLYWEPCSTNAIIFLISLSGIVVTSTIGHTLRVDFGVAFSIST